MLEFIPYSTAAGSNVREFKSKDLPASLVLDLAAGFAGAETIPCYYVGHDGTRITPVLDSNGAAFALSLTNKVLPIYFPCKISAVKPVSVAAMGVNQFTNV